MTPIDRVLNAVRSATGHEPRPSGDGWSCHCPAHDDRNPSLSVSEVDDGRVLVKCMSRGCDFNDIAAALGLTPKDFFPDGGSLPSLATGCDSKPKAGRKHQSPTKTYPTCKAAIESLETRLGERSATWTYHDADGKPVGAAVRWDKVDGKDFRPLALTPDGWIIGAMPEPRPLYQLNDVLRSDPSAVVFVVEGEKAADAMHSLSLLVTTSSGGSNAASKTDWTPLAGRSVVIIPDNDEPGRKYAQQVAGIVTKLDPPASVRLINLADDWPELPEAGDIADWCDTHDAVESAELRARLDDLIERATEWMPKSVVTDNAFSTTQTRCVLLQRI